MDLKSKIILIYGPTASGKSNFAIKLAKKIKGEIINADSIQVYKELKILSARPYQKDYKKIRHHLYGFQNARKNFSAGHWVPQQIELAGFRSAIGKTGDQSKVLSSDEIIASDPYAIALICCGYNENQNLKLKKQLLQDDRINFITPFKENKVFAFDADSYFSRPTTRILQGSIQLRKEILAN